MAFRVVEKSYFTFESDLPPQIRSLHPSGILHAFRSTPLPPNIAAQQPISNAQPQRSEHTFAWISNSLHIESAIQHLEQNGNFNRQHNIVFIPYSNKQNWINVYPHASPSMEVDGAGKVIVYLNYRPYPNALSRSTRSAVNVLARACFPSSTTSISIPLVRFNAFFSRKPRTQLASC